MAAHPLAGGYGDVSAHFGKKELWLSVGDWHEKADYAGLEKALRAAAPGWRVRVEAEYSPKPEDGWVRVRKGG